MLPNLTLLKNIQQGIKFIPNQRKESKRLIHYGLFLLGYKAGLRVSEAISFDLSKKTKRGLYLVKSKGHKERFVYIPQEVIEELKKTKWKPQQTNRFNFYHFLKRIKKELGISSQIELTPHTLRRAFATYHAERGLPLPLLQKLLGHSSIRITALYWINIYNEDNDDATDILTGKIWLEKPLKPPIELEIPVKVNLEPLPELFIPNLASKPPANHSIKDLEKQLSQIQQENNSLKSQLNQAKEQNTSLQKDLNNLTKQNTILHHQKAYEITRREQIQQELTTTQETIQNLTQELANERNQRLATENNLVHANQINNNLHQELKTQQKTNANLTTELNHSQQNNASLQIVYQNLIQKHEVTQNQLNSYNQQLKAIALMLYQWQKLASPNQFKPSLKNSQETQTQAKIIQPQPPPFFKPK